MRVVLYMQTASDDTGDAIPYQEQELGRWSDEHGHEVVGVFKDNAPGVLAKRFELQRLLTQLDTHAFDGVVVRGLSRLVRGYYDFLQFADRF